ncbi:tail fiber protein [Salmonella enterica]|nr:tail fiber protein [Salmonella enterica]EJO9071423.1 tail fiber protein [Salmonella enterica]
MGKLTETEKWEDEVYQIETSDPVLGGPDGVSNRPQKQLANRTQWLKKQLEETNIALAGHERSRNHPDATLTDRGFVKLYSGVASMDETMAATPKAVKIAMDNANARLAKDRNLADLTNVQVARQSLGLGRLATKDSLGPADVNALAKDQNLNDVPDKAKARAALGLGDVATRYLGTRPGTVAAGNDARITGAVQKTGDIMTGKLTLPQTSGFGVNTDNVLGGSSVTFGDNDTGIKQNGDGILDFYANGQLVARIAPGVLYALNAVRAGDGKKLEVSSSNNSALNARFNLWGNGSDRPTVIELGDDQGWHLYSQRKPDGSVAFSAIGDIHAGGSLHAGGNTIATDGNIYGSLWGGWLNDWINNQFAARDNNINARAPRNTASLATNGWFRDASTGLIVQWGTHPGGAGTYTVNLPQPFPHAGLWALGWVAGALYYGNDDWSNSAGLLNNSQISVTTDHSWSTAWIAIGY